MIAAVGGYRRLRARPVSGWNAWPLFFKEWFRQYLHHGAGGCRMRLRMAWRTASTLGWGGPLIVFFPPRVCEATMLTEGLGNDFHQGVAMKTLPW